MKPTREPPPPQPLPAGFRRIDESRRRSSLKPPFGVARWSDDAESMVLVARTPSVDGRVRAIEHLVAQLPEDAKRGALLLIAPFALERRGFMGGLLAPRERKLARGVRAAALLVGGYHDIGAAADAATHLTWVWGYRN